MRRAPSQPISDLKSYAAALVDEAHRRPAPVFAPVSAVSRWQRVRRRVTVAAAAVTLLGGNVGLAAAADSAAPGDALYGLDRAYERLFDSVGLGGEHAGERLEEAAVLSARGDDAAALEVIEEALEEIGAEPDAIAVLDEVASGLESSNAGDELKAAVAALIETTHSVREAARSGENPSEIAKTIKEKADAVAEAARNQRGNSTRSGPDNVSPDPGGAPGPATGEHPGNKPPDRGAPVVPGTDVPPGGEPPAPRPVGPPPHANNDKPRP